MPSVAVCAVPFAAIFAAAVVPSDCSSGTCSAAVKQQPSADSVLLQARVVKDNFLTAHPEEFAWSAGPFGDCIKCGGVARRKRTVECRSLFGNSPVPPTKCRGSLEPSATEPCSCDDAECQECEASAAMLESAVDSSVGLEFANPPFRAIGCLASDPSSEHGPRGSTSEPGAEDETCIGWAGAGPCKGGLPFYRMQSNAMSSNLCFSFCISKGLDLFGLASSGECRCGASALNEAVWRRKAPREGLSLRADELRVADTEAACPVRVFRYTGPFEGGGVPFAMTDATIGDEAYIDSVVAGHRIAPEAEEDSESKSEPKRPPPASALASGSAERGLAGVAAAAARGQPGWERPCWPHDCGPGGGSWKKRRTSLTAGITGRWAEYIVVEYFFSDEIDDVRKEAFRKAVDAWEAVTCINFAEVAVKPPPPAVMVVNHPKETDHCFASHIGYPGDHEYTDVNLGWCSDNRYVGNIIHELGHVLGMNHEQKRPDATHGYHGHGPHLLVHWQNVGNWVGQYEQDVKSYMGSGDDGPGDPQVGYASYDFGSIMLYPAGQHFETIPSGHAAETGNRRSLSGGDILQILDQYQCKEKST